MNKPIDYKDDYQYVIHIFRTRGKKVRVVNSVGFITLTELARFLLVEGKDKGVSYGFQTRKEAIEAGTEPNMTVLGAAPEKGTEIHDDQT